MARVKAKIDTGARSSALHAFAVERVRRRGKDLVRFAIHPLQRSSRRERPAVQAFLAALKDDGVRERIRALGMQPHEDG